jgi:hypothetical protein
MIYINKFGLLKITDELDDSNFISEERIELI